MTAAIQIFILLNVFVMGALVVLAAQHARAHYRSKTIPGPAKIPPPVGSVQLPADMKQRIFQESQKKFEAALNNSVVFLQHDLDSTSEQISDLIKRLATEVVSEELTRYRAELTRLHDKAENDLGSVKQVMDTHQEELKANLAKEMELEKQRLIKQIDTKLGDAVGSFLVETLQHNVDLGSQSAYLMEMLEAHKADFTKEVEHEDQAT